MLRRVDAFCASGRSLAKNYGINATTSNKRQTMTKEREEAIRRECEEASCVKYPDPSPEAMDFLNHNGLAHEEGVRTGLLRAGYTEGMFRERLRAEELVEAGEELRRFMRKPIALSDEGVRHVNDQWDRALDKYRRKP